MAVNLPLTSIIEWIKPGSTIRPTEGNRSELSVDFERIEDRERMANARLRSYFVADKRSWSVSWDMIPAPSEETVDEAAGGEEIENFYRTTPGSFTMTIQHKDSNLDETVEVMFASYDKTHVARGAHDIWNISVSLEEV